MWSHHYLYKYFFFFFCKQTTAYELRISDWSSDVCSSDLMVGERGAQQRRAGGQEDGEFVAALARDDGMMAAGAAQPLGEFAQYAVADRVAVPVVEIGRASCRARVCQYV